MTAAFRSLGLASDAESADRFCDRRKAALKTGLARASKLVAAFALLVAGAVLVSGCTPESQAELKTYAGINAIRADYGLPALKPDAGLRTVAQIRAKDMASKQYFSHTPPDGCTYVCLLQQYGIDYQWAGENIAWNTWDWSKTADVAVQMWHDSPPHLENITNCHFERFGTGVAKGGDGKVYYAMIFDGDRAC